MISLVLYTDGEGKNKTKMEKKFLKNKHKNVENKVLVGERIMGEKIKRIKLVDAR